MIPTRFKDKSDGGKMARTPGRDVSSDNWNIHGYGNGNLQVLHNLHYFRIFEQIKTFSIQVQRYTFQLSFHEK